ncbi:hypothetical protein VPHG_00100 [Vibrio phage 11895-B1]|uniref:hypothetical protein n=1 Tax=Vibrio phage 11895-B1 TaxID=754075 RepID=UPI0002C09B66|nr:hypothetical protein VPHG_00100 [Vibrio phage 11895-B1]AGH32167.1 hypothetical protein VPHG_00100 [Vibrio phage 11895-B1]
MQYLNLTTADYLTDQYRKFLMEGTQYVVRLRYNPRSGWQLALYDPTLFDPESYQNTEALLLGEKKLTPFQNFFNVRQPNNVPQGYLTLFDSEYTGIKTFRMPEINEIGNDLRYKLAYFTETEITELSAS